jgi:hypothetical protein
MAWASDHECASKQGWRRAADRFMLGEVPFAEELAAQLNRVVPEDVALAAIPTQTRVASVGPVFAKTP